MKRILVVLFCAILSLVLLVSCGNRLSGRYYFTDETYNYMIDGLLKEYGTTKDSPDYQKLRDTVIERYQYESLEYGLPGGKNFSIEFKGKNVVSHITKQNYSTKEYVPMDLTIGMYEIQNGKVYCSGPESSEPFYIGYIEDGVYWFSPEAEDFTIPLYKK